MKKYILLLLISAITFAQNPTKNAGGFFAGTGTMQSSAIGQFDSTSKGFLFPRMTTTQRNAIASPATSLVIFNTTTGAYNYYDGDSWETFGGGGSGATPNLQQVTDALLVDGTAVTTNSVKATNFFSGTLNPGLSSGKGIFIYNDGSDYYSGYYDADTNTNSWITKDGLDISGATGSTRYLNGQMNSTDASSGRRGEITPAYMNMWTDNLALDGKNYFRLHAGKFEKILNSSPGTPLSIAIPFNKPAGDYILATLDDITAPTLNEVTSTGNTSNQPIIVQEPGISNIVISQSGITRNAVENGGGTALTFPNSTILQSQQFQDASGIIALTSDIPDVADFLTDTITNGDTTHAPYGNTIYNALAEKANRLGSTSIDFEVPTLPGGANSAISRNYLDNALTGLTWKNAVKCSTTANHSLSGTANVDGVTVPGGTRVLVRFQTTTSQNGIYISAAGAWTRATDADSAAELTESTVLVTSGTLYKNTQWTQNGIVTTVGTDAVNFVQVAGAGTYINGDGIDLTANVFSVNNTVVRATGSQTLSDKTFVAPILGTPVSGNLVNCTFPTLNQNTTGTAAGLSADISQSRVTSLVTDLAGKQATLVSATNIRTIESLSLLGSGNIDLTKSDVGLGNVDNTSDANKPVSTATQTALNAKQDKVIKQGYTTLTGVTGTQVLASLLIPADWIAGGDGIEIVVVPNKSTTASAVNFLLYHDTTVNGTTNAISTATSLTTSQRMAFIQRIMSLNSTTLYNCLPVASTSLIPIAATGATPTTTFNPTVNNYITLTVNPTVGSETTGFNQFFIRKL